MESCADDELICREVQYFPGAISNEGIVLGLLVQNSAGALMLSPLTDLSAVKLFNPRADVSYLEALLQEFLSRPRALVNELSGAESGVRLSIPYRIKATELAAHRELTIGRPTDRR